MEHAMNDRHLRFHAVFCVAAAGPGGMARSALTRRFRAKAVRLDRDGLTALLDGLVTEGVLAREKVGRGERYRATDAAGNLLATVGADLPAVRYAAAEVAAVLAFTRGEPESDSVVDAVRALAPDTATGLVTLPALRRRTGLAREALHDAVRDAHVAGELLLHPIASRHQATPDEMADAIHTPSGQVLYYVELV
jgi:hypothetical protein